MPPRIKENMIMIVIIEMYGSCWIPVSCLLMNMSGQRQPFLWIAIEYCGFVINMLVLWVTERDSSGK